MATYSVYMFCDECSEPHELGVGFESEQLIDPAQRIGDLHDGRDLPPMYAGFRGNSTVCPVTHQDVSQRDRFHVFVSRVS